MKFQALAEDIGIAFRPLDHFLCYQAKITVRTPRFGPVRRVGLSDQFESGLFDVTKPLALCPPADKNGEGIDDPDAHLEAYQLKLSIVDPPQPHHVKRTGIRVANQFHPAPDALSVDTIKPDRLLVPTAKCVAASCPNPVPPLDPASHVVDHYKCYTVRVTPGTPRFKPVLNVPVRDQFTNPPKLYDITKPTRLCTPVLDKEHPAGTHTLANNPDAHLMCYVAKLSRTSPTQAKHVPVKAMFVNNQFGPGRLDTVRPDELCVPSTKTLGAGMGGP